jgi:C4-dicarboxylate-specific signal transduction histidine kinase
MIAEESERASSIPEQPAGDSEPLCHETQAELASANRVAFLGQLSASIAEINQPISAVVMNAEAALRLILAQPTDAEAVRGCSLVSSRTECALGASLTAPVR